jgi:Kef-type K+ transport system membrane component KefB
MILALALGLCSLLLGAQSHDDAMANLLLGLAVLLLAAKVAGWAVERIGQPAVLGELLIGILIGNLDLVGVEFLSFLKAEPGIEILAGLGVILLLFEVGLESRLADLMSVGLSSVLVATIGVVLPFGLGWVVSALFLPEYSFYAHAFIGATLCATSVGITARVLRDVRRVDTREAKIILGAAVVDDILGLVILAIVTGMITSAGAGTTLSAGSVTWLIAKVALFLAGGLALGVFVVPRLFRQAAKAKIKGLLFSLALAICFLLSYVATLISLAAIVGAFAAGLILEGIPFEKYLQEEERSLEDMLFPLSAFLVPLFFVQMGLKIDLASLFDTEVLGFAAALTAAAVIGKQACGLGVLERGLNRLSVGIGMIPRGEVGLIFAGVGLTLSLNGERIINEAVFAAIVVMVMVTTLIAPPLLQWSFSRKKR